MTKLLINVAMLTIIAVNAATLWPSPKADVRPPAFVPAQLVADKIVAVPVDDKPAAKRRCLMPLYQNPYKPDVAPPGGVRNGCRSCAGGVCRR